MASRRLIETVLPVAGNRSLLAWLFPSEMADEVVRGALPYRFAHVLNFDDPVRDLVLAVATTG